MSLTSINAPVAEFGGVQYVPYSFYQRTVAEFRARLADKETLIVRIGDELREALHERWHIRLEKVSLKKCPTPQKRILAYLHEVPRAEPVRMQLVMSACEMSRTTVFRHLEDMEHKGYLTRRYGENNDLYIDLNPEVERTPLTLEKITPVQRNPNWGGLREKKKEPDDPSCSNCGSPRIQGHRHESYLCDDCGYVEDKWVEIPDLPTVLLPVVPAIRLPVTPLPMSTVEPIIPPRLTLPTLFAVSGSQTDPSPLVAVPVFPPDPDNQCIICGRLRRECFIPDGHGHWINGCRR